MAWDTLLAIYREARELQREQDQQPPVACPIDGEPLETGPRGELHCPWGNYTYTG